MAFRSIPGIPRPVFDPALSSARAREQQAARDLARAREKLKKWALYNRVQEATIKRLLKRLWLAHEESKQRLRMIESLMRNQGGSLVIDTPPPRFDFDGPAFRAIEDTIGREAREAARREIGYPPLAGGSAVPPADDGL